MARWWSVQDAEGTVVAVLENYSGKLKFHDGTVVDSVLAISDDTLTVTADTIEVGTWPMKYCRASRLSDSEFELNIDGETTWFHPVDPYAFGKAAADRFVGSSIADRINVVRNMPLERMIEVTEPAKEPGPVVRRAVAVKRSEFRGPALITAGFIALAVLVAIGFSMLGNSGTTVTTEPVTATTQADVVAPDLFTSTPAVFHERWNSAALDIDARLVIGGRFGTGRFGESLADHIRLSGEVGGDGTVQSLELSIQPTTSVEETELALAAMGTAIAVAEPVLTGSQRLELIQSLGLLYPEDLTLDGINGVVTRSGVQYRLRFFDLDGVDGDLLLFSITDQS